MSQGKVKFFNQQKGFGFIVGEDEKEVFFHITDTVESAWGMRQPQENDAVSFEVVESERGPKAVKVAPAGAGSDDSADMSEDSDMAEEDETDMDEE